MGQQSELVSFCEPLNESSGVASARLLLLVIVPLSLVSILCMLDLPKPVPIPMF
uniref:Phytochrome-interacting factor 3 family protein n=1 Tax=Rhizophora mucronata TaxID=61149 RepID=A0A2P2PM56_RHIMU